MGKPKPKKAVRVRAIALDGPTPERLQHDPSRREPVGQGAGGNVKAERTVMVARGSIDHLYGLGALSFWQWWAGDQYRQWRQTGWPEPRVVGGYEARGSGGGDPSPVPLTQAAEVARRKLASLDLSIPHRQIIEAALRNDPAQERGRARQEWRNGLKTALSAASLAMGGRAA